MLPIELVRGSFYFKINQYGKEKSIMCILREMEIDDKKDFPISKRAYLLNLTSYRLKEKEPDKKWGIKSDRNSGIVTVTRVE